MAGLDFTFFPGALDELEESEEAEAIVAETAEQVRSRATSNGIAAGIHGASQALAVEPGSDKDGAFSDVGYRRTQAGIIGFQNEVGNVTTNARPHLRPALTNP